MSRPNWVQSFDAKALGPAACGQKAIGLAELPQHWAPPWMVLTTAGVLGLERRGSLPEGKGAHLFRELLRGSERGVIVRSSAVGETISQRGVFESIECESSAGQVRGAALRILETARQRDPECEMAILIQRFEDRHASGHLSNERRVSRERRGWFCELELPGARRSFRLRADSAPKKARSLRCADEVSLKRVLREIAQRMSALGDRYHLEWLWNGERIFVVQSDRESPAPGSVPGRAASVIGGSGTTRVRTRVFHTIPRKASPFPKIRNVQSFGQAGLPHGRFYVLDDLSALRELARGSVPERVGDDVERLTAMPLVIRTDVRAGRGEDLILRPRTDACLAAEAALGFLTKTAAELADEGIGAEDFAFVAHHFIPAVSGAIARAAPDSPMVRVDATWGFPDGLSFYPHDSFEFDVSGKRPPEAKLRCKYEYMDVSADGSWETKRTEPGWDWRSSLSKTELALVAGHAHRLAQFKRSEIELMSFIGVDPGSGLPSVLPWYSPTELAPLPEVEPSDRLYGGRRQLISGFSDLDLAREELRSDPQRESVQIRLRPSFENLRSRDFLEAVAALANQFGASIELEGSVLGHAYYLLAARQVPIRCIEPFVESDERQRFGKLVRDLIPVRIERHGESPTVYRATPEELRPLLREKLLEEAFEFYWSEGSAEALEELADLYELIDALSGVHGADIGAVVEASRAKRADRGGFEQGIVLVETSRRRPSSSQSRLFGGEAGPTQHTRARPEKRRPMISERRISIPLIPPGNAPGSLETTLPLDGENEVQVRYGANDITIAILRRGGERERAGQERLFKDPSEPEER
jgi:predicted house-cleaning noncanonical NTP pyrophosphatase (MazG superfamily)